VPDHRNQYSSSIYGTESGKLEDIGCSEAALLKRGGGSAFAAEASRITPEQSPAFPSRAHLLQGLKVFDYIAARKHADEIVCLHDRHLIDAVHAHLF
jgi:hypothetical protein